MELQPVRNRPRPETPPPAPRAASPVRFLPALLAAMVAAFVAGRMTAPRAGASTDGDVARPDDSTDEPRAAEPTASGRMTDRLRSMGGDPRSARSGTGAVGAEALEMLNRLPSSEQREEERLRLIEQWAATAPEAAIDYTRQNLKGDRQAQAMAKIATTWARHAPAAAWQWARKQGPSEVHHAHTVMEEIAKNAPAMAARFAADFARQEPQEAAAMALTAIRGMTYDGNFDTARRFVAELHLSAPEDQAALCNYLAGQWGRHDPEQALAWARTLPDGPLRDQALVGVGESWADVDPARAAAYAEQLPAGQSRQLALQQAVRHWGLADPTAANEWMSHVAPSPDFDQAVASLSTQREMMQQHVDLALNWASAIGDPSLRLSTLRAVVSDWALRDREAALSYVQTSPRLPAETRSALLEHLQ